MKNNAILLGALFLIIFSFGCVNKEEKTEYFTFKFYINETGEALNGNVYLNDEFLGATKNGELTIPKDEIYPGKIYLNGTYNNTQFSFEFTLKKSDLRNYTGANYYVFEKDIKDLTMDLSKIDTQKIVKHLFNNINDIREKHGIKKLVWNDKLADIAKKFAIDISIGIGYKKDISERFVKEGVYYISNGYIYYTLNDFSATDINDSFNLTEDYLTLSARNVVLDKNFDSAGIGVYCKQKECYIVAVFAQTEYTYNFELDEDYCKFDFIRWDTLPIEDVKTHITVNSTRDIDVYILEKDEDYSPCKARHYLEGEDDTKFYKTTINAKKGYGIFTYANYGDANITIKFKYEI
ncbi:MAG: CAP domain-containing protein [Nanoarchaeota archaeon]|nr:CAP domain-containing protein [Nanoarchaeota archaeon]